MTRHLLGSTVLAGILATTALLGAASASAADLPTSKGPPPAPMMVAPAFTWTGFYIGAHLGGAWDTDKWNFQPADTFTSNKASSIFGGVQAGYNYQIASFVLGAEGDISLAHLASSAACPNPNFTCGHSIDWLGSIRARAGFSPIDRALLYVTGGLALAGVDHTATPPGVAPFVFSGSYDKTRAGWALGGGGEYAFTNNISAKVEYIYYGFGTNTAPMDTLSARNTANLSNGVNQINVGLNYHF